MRTRTFGAVKIGVALGHQAAAVGGAQVFEMQQERLGGGEAAIAPAMRFIARISLGKRSIIFRIGNDAAERAHAIDELTSILAKLKNKRSAVTVPFNMEMIRCIAAAALDEMTIDMCETCKGATQVPMVSEVEGVQPMTQCPTCSGSGRRRYAEDERILKIAKEFVAANRARGSDVTVVAKELRKHDRLRELLFSVDVAKGVIAESERMAVEETAKMLEKW